MSVGYRVELDAWDWSAGDDFIQRLNESLERSQCTVAILSSAYFEPAASPLPSGRL